MKQNSVINESKKSSFYFWGLAVRIPTCHKRSLPDGGSWHITSSRSEDLYRHHYPGTPYGELDCSICEAMGLGVLR